MLAALFGGSVDVSPITETVVSALGTVLTVVIGWAGFYLKSWLATKVDLSKTQMDEQIQQMFNEYAARSIAYAETVVKGAIPKTIKVDSPVVSAAAGYLMRSWPDFIKRQGLTAERIKEAILARLPSGQMTEKADAIVLAKAAGPAAAAVKL